MLKNPSILNEVFWPLKVDFEAFLPKQLYDRGDNSKTYGRTSEQKYWDGGDLCISRSIIFGIVQYFLIRTFAGQFNHSELQITKVLSILFLTSLETMLMKKSFLMHFCSNSFIVEEEILRPMVELQSKKYRDGGELYISRSIIFDTKEYDPIKTVPCMLWSNWKQPKKSLAYEITNWTNKRSTCRKQRNAWNGRATV